MLMENDVVRMPSWMVALPCITMLMASSMLMVEGEGFLEVSLGMMLAAVPLWRPWDVKNGEPFCVQQHRWLLLKMTEQGKMPHGDSVWFGDNGSRCTVEVMGGAVWCH